MFNRNGIRWPVYLLCFFALLNSYNEIFAKGKVRIGVAGLTHGHVGWILGREDKGDIELVGIAEKNETLANTMLERFGMQKQIWYKDLNRMLDETRPQAVCAFGNIYEHLEVVRACAVRGIHVMVEKPLSFSVAHATEMANLARKHKIHLLTNYETTWYPSNREAKKLIDDGTIGDIRKLVIRDGHQGPKEIGVGPEFLEWLIDPLLNGGGAIIDFGCYGANLATWLMNGERPISVTAVTQQIKPEIYANVDDEATIILSYPKAQAIIQASWNWPISRKDMDVYGKDGYLKAINRETIYLRENDYTDEIKLKSEPISVAENDPFSYLAAVIRGDADPAGSLSSLEINLIVVEILDAALRSAKSGKTVVLK
jgi:predicted dehydrogenase